MGNPKKLLARLFFVTLAIAAGCFPDPEKIRPPSGVTAATDAAAGAGGGAAVDGGAGVSGAAGGQGSAGSSGGGAGSSGQAGSGGPGGGGGGSRGGNGGTNVDAGVVADARESDAPRDAGGGAGGTSGETRAQACAANAVAVAAKAARCTPFFVNRVHGSESAYRARLEQFCGVLDLPGATWPPRPFKPCGDAIAALTCDDWLVGVSVPACAAPGQLALGAPCATGAQCQSLFCDAPAGGCGHCVKLPGARQTCYLGQYCDEGTACGGAGTCVVPASAGAACTIDADCKSALICRNFSCVRRGIKDDPCVGDADCDFNRGFLCNPNSHVCVASSTGASCRENPDASLQVCSASAICRMDGSCLPAAADGAACSDTTGPLCVQPATCVNNRCVFPNPDKTCK